MAEVRGHYIPPSLLLEFQHALLWAMTDNAQALAARCTALCIQHVWTACVACIAGEAEPSFATTASEPLVLQDMGAPEACEMGQVPCMRELQTVSPCESMGSSRTLEATWTSTASTSATNSVARTTSWDELPPVLQALQTGACTPDTGVDEGFGVADKVAPSPAVAGAVLLQHVGTPCRAAKVDASLKEPLLGSPSSAPSTVLSLRPASRDEHPSAAVAAVQLGTLVQGDEACLPPPRLGEQPPCQGGVAPDLPPEEGMGVVEASTLALEREVCDVDVTASHIDAEVCVSPHGADVIAEGLPQSAPECCAQDGPGGDASSVEEELESLRGSVALLQEHLDALREEVGAERALALEEELAHAPPPLLSQPSRASMYLARWYVGGLTQAAAAWHRPCDGHAPTAKFRWNPSPVEVDGAMQLAEEMHAFEDMFSRGIATAEALLDLRDGGCPGHGAR